MTLLDATDRSLVAATTAGLPLVPRPFHALAEQLGLDPDDVMARFRRLQSAGIVRRIAAVPNHYALGYTANGMTVWDVDDVAIARLGPQVGALDCVSHCYRRPRHMPLWPYNLFAMVHGRDRSEVVNGIERISALLGDAARARDVLYSRRILKKTGFRLGDAA